MYKIVLFLLMSVFLLSLYANQLDREMAVHTMFRAKYALNKAAHAAAQQVDTARLAQGVRSIDAASAHKEALRYLQANLRLDDNNRPEPGTHLKSEVEVVVFEVVNEDRSFPYLYVNETYDFRALLEQPGVVMMVRVRYPRMFRALGDISWELKAVAEMTG